MTTTTKTDPIIDWQKVATRRTADLQLLAAENRVTFTDQEAARFVAIILREDGRRALEVARALVATRPPAPVARRGTITEIGVAELSRPDGPYLLLRRGDQAWLVPDISNGWEYREPWVGDVNSVNWIGGPPAIAAFRRVGALV